MEEIRVIKNKTEKEIYSIRIYSDRLKSLTRLCPDDGALISATGEMYLRRNMKKRADHWFVEYYCHVDGELIKNWSSTSDELTQEIAAEVLKKTTYDTASD